MKKGGACLRKLKNKICAKIAMELESLNHFFQMKKKNNAGLAMVLELIVHKCAVIIRH